MDNLRQFTQNNKEAFDVHQPSPELWGKVKSATVRRSIVPSWAKYAAAAVIVFAIGFGTGRLGDIQDNGGLLSKEHKAEKEQILESEYYYLTQIDERMTQLKPYFVNDPRLKTDIEVDFEELDAYCNELKGDLQDDVNNESVIEALIQSYQTKLYILESLLQELKHEDNEKAEFEI